MAMKWMMGTAVAALVAASPAFAQSGTAADDCALTEMTSEEFQRLDTDRDGALSLDEYRQCLEAAGLADDGRQAMEAAFTEANTAGDGMLRFADIEALRGTEQAAAGGVGEEGRPQGTITVEQPPAEVAVRQPAPEVTVTQEAPEVAVQQRAPEVAVETPQPEVSVNQPEPQVAVSQPEPEVSVTQPEPEVTVTQPQPEVAVEPGQPAVAVEPAEPEVAVTTPEPEVAVEQPELDVNVEQAQPEVAVEAAQPDVAVRSSGSADVNTETAAAPAATETDASAGAAAAAAPQFQIAVDDLVGQDVYNASGEEIGEVRDIRLDPGADAPVVIVRVGGFLGLGAHEVALPYDDLTVGGDRIVLDTAMSKDEVEAMPEYDEAAYEDLPDTMIVR